MTAVLLDAGYQQYDWGKEASTSFVAKMKGLSGEGDKKFAELWVGTHPSCPTRIAGSQETLDAFLKRDNNEAKFFSPAHQSGQFRGTVPYLLKILSINTALSIQAHPCKSLAEKLFAENPDKYKDPNHKPELICALTPMEALCSFRSLESIVKFATAIPQLAEVLNAKAILGSIWTSQEFPPEESAEEKRLIKAMMEYLYALDSSICANALLSHLSEVKTHSRFTEDKVFARTFSQYPNDVGCWMVYILNYVELKPGEALFLRDSEPHAYISGDGVEIMACSDNVVRAGLTPKWKDVSTLINMLTYSTTGLRTARHLCDRTKKGGWQVQYYQPPAAFPDFSIYRLQLESDAPGTAVQSTPVTVTVPTIGLGFCLAGAATVNGVAVKEGDCFAVPFGEVKVSSTSDRALLFISSTNDMSTASKM